MTWLEQADLPYAVILTKSDAIGPSTRVKWINHVCMRYHHLQQDASKIEERFEDSSNASLMSPIVHVTSSQSGKGLAELLSSIEAEWMFDDGT
jgi:GTP-binding protein EngB required for normal cell division